MTDQSEIQDLLDIYERSLNTSDVALAVSCYMSDGVFMPTTLPTATGPELQGAYDQTFAAIKLQVEFTLDELVVASSDLAYALTRSNGMQTMQASGAQTPESNREIFIFGRQDQQWKIARYMFNKPQ